MKLIFNLIIIVLLISFTWVYFKNRGQNEPILSFSDEPGSFSINIRETEKIEFKEFLAKIKNLLYKEATIHNPPGDAIPDQIDDKVIQEIKENVN